ncbi:unnamed protein product [Meloidogyne enterolobii]|uniref:Uncharacterized protein n=1 Tax=Meloidogyne enterolobii TaxID=390850 RepID=A0ACB1AJR3_MELEN
MFVKDNGEGNEHLKLIDFGSSMLLQGGKTYRFKSLALDSDIGYRSPEHKMNTGIRGYMFTTRTDIWALGVILFKLVSNDDNVKLFDEKAIPSEGNKDILQQEIMEKVDVKEKELKNKKMEPLFNVIRLCLYFDPNDRPSAENLIAFMKNECTMKIPNGKQISFNPEIAPPEDECKPSRVTREPQALQTKRLFIKSKSPLSPRTTI